MKQLAEEIGGFYDGLADAQSKHLFINLHGLVVDVQRHSHFKSTLRAFVPFKMFFGLTSGQASYRSNFSISCKTSVLKPRPKILQQSFFLDGPKKKKSHGVGVSSKPVAFVCNKAPFKNKTIQRKMLLHTKLPKREPSSSKEKAKGGNSPQCRRAVYIIFFTLRTMCHLFHYFFLLLRPPRRMTHQVEGRSNASHRARAV